MHLRATFLNFCFLKFLILTVSKDETCLLDGNNIEESCFNFGAPLYIDNQRYKDSIII